MGARGVGGTFASIFASKGGARKGLRKKGEYSKSVDDNRRGRVFILPIQTLLSYFVSNKTLLSDKKGRYNYHITLCIVVISLGEVIFYHIFSCILLNSNLYQISMLKEKILFA